MLYSKTLVTMVIVLMKNKEQNKTYRQKTVPVIHWTTEVTSLQH